MPQHSVHRESVYSDILDWTSYKKLGVRISGIPGLPKGRNVELDQNGELAQTRWSMADLGSGEHTVTFTNLNGG